MPCQCGYPDGMPPRGRIVFPRAEPKGKPSPSGRNSIRIPTLAWHICFIIPNKPQFGKISMKTTMTVGRSSEKGGGHFASGHDGMANLFKPITAYDFHVRYNKIALFKLLILLEVFMGSLIFFFVRYSL